MVDFLTVTTIFIFHKMGEEKKLKRGFFKTCQTKV